MQGNPFAKQALPDQTAGYHHDRGVRPHRLRLASRKRTFRSTLSQVSYRPLSRQQRNQAEYQQYEHEVLRRSRDQAPKSGVCRERGIQLRSEAAKEGSPRTKALCQTTHPNPLKRSFMVILYASMSASA
jgi:hypothetical protein